MRLRENKDQHEARPDRKIRRFGQKIVIKTAALLLRRFQKDGFAAFAIFDVENTLLAQGAA